MDTIDAASFADCAARGGDRGQRGVRPADPPSRDTSAPDPRAAPPCPAGCYMHFVDGRWVCCQCGN